MLPEKPIKPGKTRKTFAGESSFCNSRRCKNTAVCGAGQARTTICSVLFTLHCTNLGNSRIFLCKTLKAASLVQFRCKWASRPGAILLPTARALHQFRAYAPSVPPTRPTGAIFLWICVRVVEKTVLDHTSAREVPFWDFSQARKADLPSSRARSRSKKQSGRPGGRPLDTAQSSRVVSRGGRRCLPA